MNHILQTDSHTSFEPKPHQAMSMDDIIAMQKENAELKAENMLMRYKLTKIEEFFIKYFENKL